MTVGSLFAGIGGFDLGFERAGFEIKWQVEIDDYATRVLEQHWPGVRRYRDVRTCCSQDRADRMFASQCAAGWPDWGTPAEWYGLETVDVICGGFPCQDISHAGRRAGIVGQRSGLFAEAIRIADEVGPDYLLLENVAALLHGGLGPVLAALAAIGFDAEWDCLPAASVGAPHRRDRVWILAYPNRSRLEGRQRRRVSERASQRLTRARGASLSHADDEGQPRRAFHDGARESLSAFAGANEWWSIEPDVGRVAHGIPARVDRLRGLGNAIVPQIAEWIARRIQAAEAERRVA